MPITTFDRVHLMNLDRRPDRLESFNSGLEAAGWPFAKPLRFRAIDGQKVEPPKGYTQQPGAWGCMRGHIRIWEDAMMDGLRNVFVFEDDCVFHRNFATMLPAFLADVPDDWDMIYLGGLHRYTKADQAERVTDRCYRAWGVTGTWAYAISAKFMPIIYQHFASQSLFDANHIDQMLCKFQIIHRPKVYIPYPWLCGMKEGESDICGRVYMGDAWWHWTPQSEPKPFHAIELLGRIPFANGQGQAEFRNGFNIDLMQQEQS